jgi:hypothetical protein
MPSDCHARSHRLPGWTRIVSIAVPTCMLRSNRVAMLVIACSSFRYRPSSLQHVLLIELSRKLGHNLRECRARIRRVMPCRTFCPCDASQNDTLMEQREGQFRAGTVVACLRDVVGPHCWASGLPAIRPPTVPSRRLRSTTARTAKADWHEALLEAHAAYLLTAAPRAVDLG